MQSLDGAGRPDPAPIALFVFNRPSHTGRVLASLAANPLARSSPLFIFSDGPRAARDTAAVAEVRRLIRAETRFQSVAIHEQVENRGLARSIQSGVTALTREFDRVIVLEDDLVTGPHFLDFMNEALRRYAACPEVMQISGYLAPIAGGDPQRPFFLPLTTSWGWATWKRAWEHFDPAASEASRVLDDVTARNRFDLGGAFEYSAMLRDSLAQRNASWAIRWYLSVFLRNGLVLYPGTSLVQNIGFDGSGVHCGTESLHQADCFPGTMTTFPSRVAVDQDRWERLQKHLARTARPSVAPAARRGLVTRMRTAWRGARRWLRERVAVFFHQVAEHGRSVAARRACAHDACVDPAAIICPEAVIRNLAGTPERIRVAEGTTIRGELLVFAHAGHVRIGRDCYVGDHSRIWSSASVTIGDRVLISHGVNIHDTNGHPLDATARHEHYLQIIHGGHPRHDVGIAARPIVIEDDAWIGFNATILKGVRIGRGAIVAANAVVVADVPAAAVVAGNPARCIHRHETQADAA